MERHIRIADYDYLLPDERIAKFPLAERSASKLLVWHGGTIGEARFADIADRLPAGQLLVFNNTKVIRARIVMHKPTGARIEVFCLEPHDPADYERAFAAKGFCTWSCIVGNLKKWKEGHGRAIRFEHAGREEVARGRNRRTGRPRAARALRVDGRHMTFGQLLEHLGRIPIPPYLNRDSEEIDNTRYQTVYSKFEGSVAAPTAGFTSRPSLIGAMKARGFDFEEVTLHVSAQAPSLPVKEEEDAAQTRDAHRALRDPADDASDAAARKWGRSRRWAPPRCGRSNRRRRSHGACGRAARPSPGGRQGSGSPTTFPPPSRGAEALDTLIAHYGAEGHRAAEGRDADHDHAAGLRIPASCATSSPTSTSPRRRCCCSSRPTWGRLAPDLRLCPRARLPFLELRRLVAADARLTRVNERDVPAQGTSPLLLSVGI